MISRHPGLEIQLNGYTDSKGNEDYNVKLSLSRALTVEAYLKSRNLPAGSISVNAFGERNPVALNANANGSDNPLGRSYNRRVELVITRTPAEVITIRYNDVPEDLLIH
jgi:OOP family OmpA-OmpF porin